ncbi:MAG: tetratricopeptide repeat protein [Verrucomicrobia bacterium]|nr:tetratricopeptide repeat protein [Verrucomicrobiota bacterium]
MENDSQPRFVKWICLALALITFALYAPALRFEFLDYDDDIFVTKNEQVQKGLVASNVGWAFTNFKMALWHPLTWFSHMADWQFFGSKPWGHHLSGILLHAANTVLLFLVLRGFSRRLWPSAVVAALFAWHPFHVESVAWVSERKDVLSCFFWLLTMWAYLFYTKKQSLERYTLVAICFALGLMAKPMLVTLPFVLFMLDVWPLDRLKLFSGQAAPGKPWWRQFSGADVWRLVRDKLPLLALAIGVSAVTVKATQVGGAFMSFDSLPLSARLANAVFSYGLYVVKTFWPSGLAVFYPHIARPAWQYLGAGVLLLTVTIWVVRDLRRRPYLAFGWFWFLGTLVPAIQIIQTGGHAYADRYTYIPLIGVFLMLAWGVAELAALKKWPVKNLALATGAAFLACLVASTLQLRHWKNNFTLFSHALEHTTHNYTAHGHIGGVYLHQGKLDEAIHHYSLAVKYWTKYVQAHNNLGAALFKKGRIDEAIVSFQNVVAIKPEDVDAHFNLGICLSQKGRSEEAVKSFSQAVKLKPNYADAQTGLGTALLSLGRAAEAVTPLVEAARLKPNATEHMNAANALGRSGMLDQAAEHYRAVLRLRPEMAEARMNLAGLLDTQGKSAEALAIYEEMLRQQPEDLNAMAGLAQALLKLKRHDEAIARYRFLLTKLPDSMETRNNLGWALAAKGQPAEAIVEYREALRLNPNSPDTHNNLALALKSLGKTPEAVPHFAEAVRLRPGFVTARIDLGEAYIRQGKFAEAAEQFEAVLKMKPGDGFVHYNMGLAQIGLKKIIPAIEHLRLAVQYSPNLPTTFNALAWILAAHPDPKIRNGEEAVKLATRAIELSGKPSARLMNTLAVAQAQAGKYDEALATAAKAVEQANATSQKELAAQIQKQMQAYQLKRPFHDAALPR